MADEEPVHPRPDQAEEPPEDIGASNVDLDEARHGPDHESPAAPEPEHDPDADDDHGHDAHDDVHGHDDDHDDHPVEDPRWVLLPLLAGLVLGAVLIAVFGFAADANPFNLL